MKCNVCIAALRNVHLRAEHTVQDRMEIGDGAELGGNVAPSFTASLDTALPPIISSFISFPSLVFPSCRLPLWLWAKIQIPSQALPSHVPRRTLWCGSGEGTPQELEILLWRHIVNSGHQNCFSLTLPH